jgi:hypothetical protein
MERDQMLGQLIFMNIRRKLVVGRKLLKLPHRTQQQMINLETVLIFLGIIQLSEQVKIVMLVIYREQLIFLKEQKVALGLKSQK